MDTHIGWLFLQSNWAPVSHSLTYDWGAQEHVPINTDFDSTRKGPACDSVAEGSIGTTPKAPDLNDFTVTDSQN